MNPTSSIYNTSGYDAHQKQTRFHTKSRHNIFFMPYLITNIAKYFLTTWASLSGDMLIEHKLRDWVLNKIC